MNSLRMDKQICVDIQEKLAADVSGIYKRRLIDALEGQWGELLRAKRVFLTPDEYRVVDQLEQAVEIAISVIKDYSSVESSLPYGELFEGNNLFV